MKKIVSIAAVSAFILGAAVTAFAGPAPVPSAPSADTMYRLEVATLLEQARGPEVQRTGTAQLASPKTRTIDDLLNRIYRGDQVDPQEINNALSR